MGNASPNEGAGGLPATIATPRGEYDLAASLHTLGCAFRPDVVLVRADATGSNLPRNLASVPGTKVLMVGDTQHLARPLHRMVSYALSEPYDIVLSSHNRQHLHFFIEAGVRNVRWLPNMDADCPTSSLPPQGQRAASVLVAGQIGRFHPARMRLVEQLRRRSLPIDHQMAVPAILAKLYCKSVVALNCSLNGDLNLRIAEVLSAGGCLVTDHLRPQSGLDLLYEDRRDLYTFADENEAGEIIEHLLAHPDGALATARRGWTKQTSEFGFAAQRRRLFRLFTRDETDPLFDLRREPRCLPRETKSRVLLADRIAIYEHCQELNRQRASVRIGLDANIDPTVVTDLADLNHTQLVLVEGPTATALRASPAFSDLRGVLSIVDRAEFSRVAHDVLLQVGGTSTVAAGDEFRQRYGEIVLDSDPYRSQGAAIEVLLANNQGHEARQRLEAFVARMPDSAEAHNDLAVVRQMEGDLTGALEAIERAVALSPGKAVLHRNRAAIYLAAGALVDALRAVEAAMTLQPNDAETLLVAGDISVALRRLDDARIFYAKAGEISPRFANEALARSQLISSPSPDNLVAPQRLENPPHVPKVVVSLTSYQPRLATVGLTNRTLMSQRTMPDAIVLWLFRGDLDGAALPYDLPELQRKGLTVRIVDEDIRQYKKLVYALVDYPNDLIITCDDDALYPQDFVQGLLEAHRSFPAAVAAYRCRWMRKEGGGIASYMTWRNVEYNQPSFNLFPTGVGGILYPPGALHADVFRRDIYLENAPTADDIWFKFMALRNGTETVQVGGRFREFPTIPETQTNALWRVNATTHRCDNDAQIRNLSALYDVSQLIE